MIGTWDFSRQLVAYSVLALVAAGMVAILLPAAADDFTRYVGGVHPLLVVVLAAAAGLVALISLHRYGGFQIVSGRATLRGLLAAAGAATFFAAAVVIADLLWRYPAAINVPWPRAWLFYPAIGLVAEIVFHLVPFAVLLFLLSPLRDSFGQDRLFWTAAILVALLEPTFQAVLAREPLSPRTAYTWVHIFAIALCQLALFKRYDFASMYAFRVVYYAYWHVLWGALRLILLF